MNTNAAGEGPALSEGLGLAPERAVFDRWLRDNGHCEDQHDDMLMPLQRSLNELMWSAWRGATAVERERGAALCLRVAHEARNSDDARAAGRKLANWISRGDPNDNGA